MLTPIVFYVPIMERKILLIVPLTYIFLEISNKMFEYSFDVICPNIISRTCNKDENLSETVFDVN